MSKRSVGAAVVAAGVFLGAGITLLLGGKKKSSAPSTPPQGSTPPSSFSGPFLPLQPRILVVGERLAHGFAVQLRDYLNGIAAEERIDVAPQHMAVWEGKDAPAQIEAFATAVKEHGVPPAATTLAGARPDVVIVLLGDYNAMWGPSDDGTSEAIAHLTRTFSSITTDHNPNVLWIGPWQRELPFQVDVARRILTDAIVSAPLRSAVIVPADGTIEMTDDPMVPTEYGYLQLAMQATDLLIDWHRRRKAAA